MQMTGITCVRFSFSNSCRFPRRVARLEGISKACILRTPWKFYRCLSYNRSREVDLLAGVSLIPLIHKRHISQAFHSKYLSPEFPPIGYAQDLLEAIHSSFGLPWWTTIALATFTLRSLVTLPLMVFSAHNVAKVELLQPEIKSIAQELATEVSHAQRQRKWSPMVAKQHYRANMKRLVKNLYVRENCHPFKEYIVPWIQIPMWISMSLALRNMAGAFPVDGVEIPVLCLEFATGGALWFSNLLVPDSTFILPFIMCFTNLIIIEMNQLKVQSPTVLQKSITYGFRGLVLIMFPIAASVPSCMCLYWTCSSIYGLLQNVFIRLPNVRRFLRIPKTPSESQTPFVDLVDAARNKYTFKSNRHETKKKNEE